MALPDSLVHQVGTVIVLADTTDHSPATNNNLGTRTDQIDLTSVADSAARQSDKLDFGASRAPMYSMYAAFEFAATPVAGETVEIYLAPSMSTTAAVGNPGGVTGSYAAYTGTSASTLEESVLQLMYIGNFVCTDDLTGTVQISQIGQFVPPERFGSIVVKNESGAAFHSDMVETSILITPVNHVIID
jgi:hypothetical protein